jgi:hypothetical protein
MKIARRNGNSSRKSTQCHSVNHKSPHALIRDSTRANGVGGGSNCDLLIVICYR